jgi:hypothetical protein
MADELYDEDFHVTYPSWMLVKKDCVARNSDGTVRFVKKPNWLVFTDDQGEESVPVFTDEDTAASYCQVSNHSDDAEAIPVADAQELAYILARIEGTGVATLVVFDPKKDVGAARCVWPIDYAVERLRKGLGLRR